MRINKAGVLLKYLRTAIERRPQNDHGFKILNITEDIDIGLGKGYMFKCEDSQGNIYYNISVWDEGMSDTKEVGNAD